jgi:hypothetical protein
MLQFEADIDDIDFASDDEPTEKLELDCPKNRKDRDAEFTEAHLRVESKEDEEAPMDELEPE